MKIENYAPCVSPTLEQQRDALQKGLGRAKIWSAAGRLDNDVLLEACLNDWRYDEQCEDSRGEWLWELIVSNRAVERFQSSILKALTDLSVDSPASQLCELAYFYAASGDHDFRRMLYDIVRQKPVHNCLWYGEEEIIRLDGDQGFWCAVVSRGRNAPEREWDWDDGALIDKGIELFGEGRVLTLLESSALSGAKAFLEMWKAEQIAAQNRAKPKSHRERMRAYTVDDAINAAHTGDKFYWLGGWGKHADSFDLSRIFDFLLTTSDLNVRTKLLRVFSNRELPVFDERLLELCRSEDSDLRDQALHSLASNSHPLVRQFAKTKLNPTEFDVYVVKLFVKNYQAGDEHLIFDALSLPTNQYQLHCLLWDIVKLLEKNPSAECRQLALMVYGMTPCENCRFNAARLLKSQNSAPDWLIEECHLDSNISSRTLFQSDTEGNKS